MAASIRPTSTVTNSCVRASCCLLLLYQRGEEYQTVANFVSEIRNRSVQSILKSPCLPQIGLFRCYSHETEAMKESWGQRKGGSMKETVPVYRRHDISDETWALLEPHLPGRWGVWGGIAEDNRLFINAVFWILRTGAPWRDLPPDYGGWSNTHRRFIRWRNKGIWEKLLEILIDEPDLDTLKTPRPSSPPSTSDVSFSGSRSRDCSV